MLTVKWTFLFFEDLLNNVNKRKFMLTSKFKYCKVNESKNYQQTASKVMGWLTSLKHKKHGNFFSCKLQLGLLYVQKVSFEWNQSSLSMIDMVSRRSKILVVTYGVSIKVFETFNLKHSCHCIKNWGVLETKKGNELWRKSALFQS